TARARDSDGDLRPRIDLLEFLGDGLADGVDGARPVDGNRAVDGGQRPGDEAGLRDQYGDGQDSPYSVHLVPPRISWRLPASWRPGLSDLGPLPGHGPVVPHHYHGVNGPQPEGVGQAVSPGGPRPVPHRTVRRSVVPTRRPLRAL